MLQPVRRAAKREVRATVGLVARPLFCLSACCQWQQRSRTASSRVAERRLEPTAGRAIGQVGDPACEGLSEVCPLFTCRPSILDDRLARTRSASSDGRVQLGRASIVGLAARSRRGGGKGQRRGHRLR